MDHHSETGLIVLIILNRMALTKLLVYLLLVGATLTSSCDLIKGDVYSITFTYSPGDNPGSVWRFLLNSAAEECLDDRSINTVKIRIEGVPKPRPLGWQNSALSASEDCDELISSGYPYR